MIVVYHIDDLSHSHPLIQVQSDPLSRRFRIFLILQLEPFAKVHVSEWPSPMCEHNLTSRSTSSNCCTAMLISVRDWQKHAHLHTNTNSCTHQIFGRLRSLLQYKHWKYEHKNWHSQNCTKHDDKKQNTINIGIFKQFTFALWQTETGMKFPFGISV